MPYPLSPICYTLTTPQLETAITYGLLRQIEAVKAGRRDKHGLEKGKWKPEDVHIMGTGGEISSAEVLHIDNFIPTVNTYKTEPDLPHPILRLQVRTRGRHDYDLLVRQDDNPNDIFIHATTEDLINYQIHGWMYGREAMDPAYLRNYGNREWAFFRPHSEIHDIRELIELTFNR